MEHSRSLLSVDDGPLPDFRHVLSEDDINTAIEWALLLRESFAGMTSGQANLSTACLDAPRRRHADPKSAALSVEIARLLYPAPSNSAAAPVIKYEKDIVLLRKTIIAQRHQRMELDAREHETWRKRIMDQGPWDETNDPWTEGAPALPMPVAISDRDRLMNIFEHLRVDGGFTPTSDARVLPMNREPPYGAETLEFEKGIMYKDGRLDLCKKVLGPQNIVALMKSLESNRFIRHFLLGNNVIGPVGARAIADFVKRFPERMETWYLAGNCIDSEGFKSLVAAWKKSNTITNIWLKRNPLGPGSVSDLYELITITPSLRTLDLDQTELGSEKLALLFFALASTSKSHLPLRNLYLNAVGVGEKACKAIAAFLCSPACGLESLYLSNNPIGNNGAIELATGLRNNKTLLRLSMSSCGLKSKGAAAIFVALSVHPRLMTLKIGQSYATQDLGSRYNFITDSVAQPLEALVIGCKTLRMLDLGATAMSPLFLDALVDTITRSHSLVVVGLDSIYGKLHRNTRPFLRAHLEHNVRQIYGDMTMEGFQSDERRWLESPIDVRFIDSSYRNRDAGLARRGLMKLNKWWEDG